MRNRYVLLADVPLIAIAAVAAFAVRFDWRFYDQRPEFPAFVIAAMIVKPAAFLLTGMYRRYWKYASVEELLLVTLGVSVGSIGMVACVIAAAAVHGIPQGFSRVVLFTDWLFTLACAGGLRFGIRVFSESQDRSGKSNAEFRRILIVGAGDAGALVAREMRRNRHLNMKPIGFLDDDPAKVRKRIAGLQVLGKTSDLAAIVAAQRVDNVVIAMPKVGGRTVRQIVERCNAVGVASQTIPGVFELLDGQVSVSRLRKVEITDLLRRNPVDSTVGTAAFVTGRVALITGAGGSIGAELARQVAYGSPAQVVLLGHGENSIFEVEAQLRESFPRVKIATAIADIRDPARLRQIFDRYRPEIVFHTAAHKHVPLMEENPEEAVTNNVIGTRNVVTQALRVQTERLVLISTDKAVAPSSVMGATKRVAETIVRRAAVKSGRAFVTVRFGNVLASRGSVVQTFKRQIEIGGPVTVTDPNMTRFFMTIPEAVHLVLQASGAGQGGELFVLDMGEPMRIVDLARDLIHLSGMTEEEVPIVFTGVRPGEKMHEALCDEGMKTVATPFPEVLEVVGDDGTDGLDLDAILRQFEDAAARGDRAAIEALLRQAVPGFASVAPIVPPALAEPQLH
jgi:FlaA1/EpsC-like NDP-sugar epimerase